MRKKIPVALTIAGSDSGGGAGIQADLKTFAALGVHGTSALTCITAQNPKRVLAVAPCGPRIVEQQMKAVFEELPPAAIKTGMLFSEEIVRVVADFFRNSKPKTKNLKLVVDPVMISTSGAQLLKLGALKRLQDDLLPLATLVTPNLPEAEILIGRKITSSDEMRRAAREIHRRYGCAVLVKGGHLRGSAAAIDIFFDGKTELELAALRVNKIKTHGTGCTLSAAITGYLALNYRLPEAVSCAKLFISQTIAQSQRAGRHCVLNCLCRLKT